MRRLLTEHRLALASALLAGLACWWVVPPQPRWTVAPPFTGVSWDKVVFSDDGAWLAAYQPTTPDNDLRKLTLWDTATGALLSAPHEGAGQLESLAIAPDKRRLAVWWANRRISVWDLDEGKVAGTRVHQAKDDWYPHVHIVFRPGGELLLYGPEITTGKLWHAATGDLAEDLALDERDCNGWTTDFPEFIIGSSDRAIYLWSLRSGKMVAEVPEGGSVVAVRTRGAGTLVVGYRPRDFERRQVLCFYDTASGATRTLPWKDVNWAPFDISSDGRTVALQSHDERPITAWFLRHFSKAKGAPPFFKMGFVDIENGRLIASLQDGRRARFSPDGGSVAVSRVDGVIAVYDWPLRTPWGWIASAAAVVGIGWGLVAAAGRRVRARRHRRLVTRASGADDPPASP